MVILRYRVKQVVVNAWTVVQSQIFKPGAKGRQIDESFGPYVRTACQFLGKCFYLALIWEGIKERLPNGEEKMMIGHVQMPKVLFQSLSFSLERDSATKDIRPMPAMQDLRVCEVVQD